ncbi:MAG TPA: RHS repeat-associated core domain-containing protein [Thermoanaerobaculia bacterium]|nr:RHS repeat-associated core domain-containing protein [Thermoanaerobaculia bacterium]
MPRHFLAASLALLMFVTPVTALAGEMRAQPQAANVSWTTGTYAYDAAGNIISVGPNSDGNTDTYRYDAFGRLKESTAYTPASANGQTFTYDPYGNLTLITTGAASLCVPSEPATNHIGGPAPIPNCATTIVAGYDRAGNQTSVIGGAAYEYDALSMMTALADGPRLERYLYDADDQRVATVYTGTPQRWRYTLRDLDQKFVREYEDQVSGSSHAWHWTRDYLYANQGALATVSASEGRRHLHPDHLGTPRLITTDEGKLVSLRTLMPFGAEATGSLDDAAEVLKFTGHERDYAAAGGGNDLDYMHARYYAPRAGRFLSIDPTWSSADAARPQTWNRYAYVMNNPVRNVDPDGRCPDGCLLEALAVPLSGFVVFGFSAVWLISRASLSGLSLQRSRPGPVVVPPAAMSDSRSNFPPYPTTDPTQPPAEGWEWRGPDAPGGERGGWVDPATGESLHPNLDHAEPIGPHWDYNDGKQGHWRLYPDGRVEPKNPEKPQKPKAQQKPEQPKDPDTPKPTPANELQQPKPVDPNKHPGRP